MTSIAPCVDDVELLNMLRGERLPRAGVIRRMLRKRETATCCRRTVSARCSTWSGKDVQGGGLRRGSSALVQAKHCRARGDSLLPKLTQPSCRRREGPAGPGHGPGSNHAQGASHLRSSIRQPQRQGLGAGPSTAVSPEIFLHVGSASILVCKKALKH